MSALQDLQDDSALKKAKALKTDGGLAHIKAHAPDISESKGIQGHPRQDSIMSFFHSLLGPLRALSFLLLVAGTSAESTQHGATFQPDYILRATAQNITIDCESHYAVVLNGTSPAPPLYFREGWTTWVRVYNDIPDQNLTVHWHGLAMRSAPFSDGTPLVSQWPIGPDNFFDYEIHPESGDAGTYFYHSHIGLQAISAAGPLIIEECGPPPYEYDENIVLQIGDYYNKSNHEIEEGLLASPFKWSGETKALTVNGHSGRESLTTAPDPSCAPLVIKVEPCTTYRLRVIGGTAISLVTLGIEGHSNLTLIEADGFYSKPFETDHIQVASGQRFSAIFTTKSADELKELNQTSFFIRYENRERPGSASGYAILAYDIKNAKLPKSLPATSPVTLPKEVSNWAESVLQPYDASLKPFPRKSTRTVIIKLNQVGEFVNSTWKSHLQWAQNGLPWEERVPKTPYLVDIYKRGQEAIPDYNVAVAGQGYDPKTAVFPAKLGEIIDIVWENNNGASGGWDIHPLHGHGPHYWDLGSGNGTYNATEMEQRLEGFEPMRRDTTMLYRAWRHMVMGMQSVWSFGDADDILGRFPTPRSDDGLTKLVEWDKYSLSVKGERVFIYSGEFHYQRLPVPELWPDIFQKFKANGLNAVSIYFFWSYHSPSKGLYDFKTGAKDIQKVLDYAKQAGLYVIARPGLYNPPPYVQDILLIPSQGRTQVSAILAKNQITNGGPVIMNQVENELQETVHEASNTLVKYMEQLKKAYRDAGIVVPFMHNEKGMRGQSWSTDYLNVGGAVNLYGLDSYPGGQVCTDPSKGFKLVTNYHEWFSNYSFTQPGFQPEFQAGWFSPWGGTFYDDCPINYDPSFADVFYKNNIGQRVTLMNLYMGFGGTNWGHSAAPVVYTSYDYHAPLQETRQIRNSFRQSKLLALFTRVSTDLLKTDLIGYGAGGFVVNSKAVTTWYLKNPDSGAGFYVLQQTKSPSQTLQTFSLTVSTSLGARTIPEVVLDGRQSKIVVTDYKLGGNYTLLYTTAEVLTFGLFDRPVLVLYLKSGQKGEFAFKEPVGDFKTYLSKSTKVSQVLGVNGTSRKFVYTQGVDYTVLDFAPSNTTGLPGPLVYLLDIPSAWSFYAPPTTLDPNVRPDQQVFVLKPYLVRNATVGRPGVFLVGDNDIATTIEVYVGDPSISNIIWNGKVLLTTRTPYGSLTAPLSGADGRAISLPDLKNWKMADSLPELNLNFDDSKWVVCNKTSTLSPVKPLTLPVLYSSDYGYYTGIKVYRGYFGAGTGARLTVSGGTGFGWSAWVNGKFVGGNTGETVTAPGMSTSDAVTKGITNEMLNFVYALGNVSASGQGRNVLTVLVDYHGHDQTSVGPMGAENPRGILGAKLLGSGTNGTGDPEWLEWKMIGNAGAGLGQKNNLDMVRGPMNEGGLFGERMGWHLPGFNDSSWKNEGPINVGLKKAGVNFYRTTFSLDIPEKLDVPLGIEITSARGTLARVQIFINGYNYGKYVSHIGPQTKFPIPPGIINQRGQNTLALSFWSQDEAYGAKLSSISLIKYGVYETGYEGGFGKTLSYLQPGWKAGREAFK
ncbi:hypothetical protein BLS_008331 [Venturia inaequalis]|uniref:beta-galactosidase n=1 Tax=Venturia inaequalis TaxID=5025 RepID=A0A8H3Z9K1_VENIN|nr:hypothetical protein BLS_008331 [Venturia inaequalis]